MGGSRMNLYAKVLIAVFFLLLTIRTVGVAQVQEGDTLSFWSVAYIDWDPGVPMEQRLITAVCNRAGEHCYVFIDTSVTTQPNQSRIDDLVEAFDTDYSQNLPPLYGPIPDEFDNDHRVFILVIPSEGWTGYFDPAQQMADSLVYRIWEKHSSEREIIYIAVSAFSFFYEFRATAHELGHMIHWGQDHSPEPPKNPVIYWEEAWIDESFSNFATVYLIEDVTIPNVNDPYAYFTSNPDLSLIYFLTGTDYNQMKLWSTFMYEQYGEEFTSTLIQDQANGILGVSNTLENIGLTETFDDTFEHWILANYLDDEEYQGGRYSYNHYNFGPCYLTYDHISYPTGLRTESVQSYAVDYVRFRSTEPASITIDFAGDSTSIFRLAAILYDGQNSEVEGIVSIPLDIQNRGVFVADSLGSTYNQIVLAVMNVDSSLGEDSSAVYSYTAEIEPTGIIADRRDPSGVSRVVSYSLGQNYPNPFNPSTNISFDIPGTPGSRQQVNLTVYDIHGKRVRNLIDSGLEPGSHRIAWDGRNDMGETVPSGIYIYTLRAGEHIYTRKMTILK
jgi:hypothetical protein